jgi:hypothetical protein
MSILKIEINGGRTEFEPGEALEGTVGWQLDQPAAAVELRLFWYTSGMGNQDAGVVDCARFGQPSQRDSRPFHFWLPPGPPSFNGRLITLSWALELVAKSSNEVARVEIVIAPGGEPVPLDGLPNVAEKKSFFQLGRR